MWTQNGVDSNKVLAVTPTPNLSSQVLLKDFARLAVSKVLRLLNAGQPRRDTTEMNCDFFPFYFPIKKGDHDRHRQHHN